MNPVYSLRSTTHSKNFSDIKEFLFPPCDSLLPSHQREDVTYQWYSGLDQFWYNDHSLLDQKYDPTQPLMAGHEKQPLPLAFFFQSFPFQTSLHPDHHHFCKILCRRFFFNGHLTLDLASLLYNKCKCNWFPLSLCFWYIFYYLFLLDPVVGNLFNCFFELLLWVDPAKKHFSDDDLPNKVNKESPPPKNKKKHKFRKIEPKVDGSGKFTVSVPNLMKWGGGCVGLQVWVNCPVFWLGGGGRGLP